MFLFCLPFAPSYNLLTHFSSPVVWEKKNEKRIDEMRVVFFLSPFLFPFPLFLFLFLPIRFPVPPPSLSFLISSSLCFLKQVHICSSFNEANGGFEEITFSRFPNSPLLRHFFINIDRLSDQRFTLSFFLSFLSFFLSFFFFFFIE